MELGYCALKESEIEERISKLKDLWPGSSYDTRQTGRQGWHAVI